MWLMATTPPGHACPVRLFCDPEGSRRGAKCKGRSRNRDRQTECSACSILYRAKAEATMPAKFESEVLDSTSRQSAARGPQGPAPRIELIGVTKCFDSAAALCSISLKFEPGKTTVLIG